MKIEFTPQALSDLEDIRTWFRESDPATADRIISRVRQTAMIFEDFPMMGHEGRVAGTREFKVTGLPYLIVYAITSGKNLDILTIIHTRRDYP